MTCVIVNDASCLIDLRKGGLLEALCDLPYRLLVPLPVRASEVLDFAEQQWQHLKDHGLITYDLTPDEVEQAFALKGRHRALSANDCFCLVTALVNRGILLTGDALLRKVAAERGLRVHGVLWVIDELAAAEACDIGPAGGGSAGLEVRRLGLPPKGRDLQTTGVSGGTALTVALRIVGDTPTGCG